MKTCMYDNERCFNLDERQEEEKKVKAKDVFQGYKAKKPKVTKKKTKVAKKKSKY